MSSSNKAHDANLAKAERDLKLLDRVATYIYGSRWQSDLARDLGMNERTVRSWVQLRFRISPQVWADVSKLLEKKVAKGEPVVEAMQKKLAKLVADADERAKAA